MARKRPAKQPARPPGRIIARGPSVIPDGYAELLEDLKSRVRAAQTRATFAANRELIVLCWDIGRMISERQEREGWGRNIVERLAGDIQKAFPGVQGFSARNVWRMRSFYLAYRQ
jgi:hypothetical protein